MKKTLSFFDIFRFVVTASVFILVYLTIEGRLLSIMQTDEITMMFLVKRYFLIEGLGSFISLFLGLLFVSRRYRVVAGTLVMVFFLVYYLVAMVLTSLSGYIPFLSSVVGLSFVGVGTCSAILIWTWIDSKLKPQIFDKEKNIQKKFPKTSIILMFLAIASVPATYITLVISAFITLGISIWLLAIVLQLPRIPIFILVALGIAPLVSLWAAFRAIKAMFFSKPSFQSAVKLNLSEKPHLRAVIAEVCATVKTKFPDTVILHVEPTFFVTEGGLKCLDGLIKGRTLAIGAPLIRNLQLNEFRAILAHEFAHFSGNDTLYSQFVVPVYKSINSAMNDIVGVGQNNKQNDSSVALMSLILIMPLLFLRVFLIFFATIDNILSRSRELRADWIAASNFGSVNMNTGLTKVVQISRHYQETIEKVGFDNHNYFDAYGQQLISDSDKMNEYKERALGETEQVFDSHPTLATRLASLPDNTEGKILEGEIETIIKELSVDEQRLSKEYQGLVKNYLEGEKRNEQARREFDLLNSAQMTVVNVLFENSLKKLKLLSEDKGYLSAYLITCELVLDKAIMKRISGVLDLMKQDKEMNKVVTMGAAVRVNLLDKYGLTDDSKKIVFRFNSLGTDIATIKPLPTLEEYVNAVQVFKQGQSSSGKNVPS